jgi:hypothetical protein
LLPQHTPKYSRAIHDFRQTQTDQSYPTNPTNPTDSRQSAIRNPQSAIAVKPSQTQSHPLAPFSLQPLSFSLSTYFHLIPLNST